MNKQPDKGGPTQVQAKVQNIRLARMRQELEQMRGNPLGNWQIRDLRRICNTFGLKCSKPRGGGSHFKISSPLLEGILTVPARRPIKPVYIRSFVDMMDAHIEVSAKGENDE